MILLWFILGIALILCIARYNESNKLFWTLLFSYVMGFAGAKMVLDINRGEHKSNIDSMKIYPTQVSSETLSTNTYYIANVTPKTKTVVTAHKSVGQDTIFKNKESDVTLSEVSERTRDQPQITRPKPPEINLRKWFFNTS